MRLPKLLLPSALVSLVACGGTTVTDVKDAAPDAPPVDAPPDVPVVPPAKPAFAFTKMFAGECDRTFLGSDTAWKKFGHDIDGKTTTGVSTDVCKRAPGAPSSNQADGDNGIDNAFGGVIVPLIRAASSTIDMSKQWSDAISKTGARTSLLALGDIKSDTQPLTANLLVSIPLGGIPGLDGKDAWPISEKSYVANNPAVTFPSAALTTNTIDTGVTSGTTYIAVSFGPAASWTIPVRHARITGTLSADGKQITNGIVSGIIPTEEALAALKIVAGTISSTLCGSSFDGVAQQIRQAQDILADGTQDPLKSCDSISIGLGFEGSIALAGATKADPPPPNPCP